MDVTGGSAGGTASSREQSRHRTRRLFRRLYGDPETCGLLRIECFAKSAIAGGGRRRRPEVIGAVAGLRSVFRVELPSHSALSTKYRKIWREIGGQNENGENQLNKQRT